MNDQLLEDLSHSSRGHPDLDREVALALGADASGHLTTSIAGIIHYIDRHHSDWTLTRLGPAHYAATIHARQMSFGATPALALCGAAIRARPPSAAALCGPASRAPSPAAVAPP